LTCIVFFWLPRRTGVDFMPYQSAIEKSLFLASNFTTIFVFLFLARIGSFRKRKYLRYCIIFRFELTKVGVGATRLSGAVDTTVFFHRRDIRLTHKMLKKSRAAATKSTCFN
jgi:hypothetical protein